MRDAEKKWDGKIGRVAHALKPNQTFGFSKKKGKKTQHLKADSYLFVIQILQRFFAGALPDLHLPRLGDVGLPVDDGPLAPAPARVQVERLVVRGAFHGAEHAAEFLPRPGGAFGAHAPEEGWHIPGSRHAVSGWSPAGWEKGRWRWRWKWRWRWRGWEPGVVPAWVAAAFRSAGGSTYSAKEKLRNAAEKKVKEKKKKTSHSSIWECGRSRRSLPLGANSLELLTHEFQRDCS